MALSYLASALISDVHLRGMIPTSTNPVALTDANILRILNQEMQAYVVRILTEIGDEYLVATSTQNTVASTSSYAVPDRAIGTKVRDVQIRYSSAEQYRSMQRIPPEMVVDFQPQTTTGFPTHYYLQMDNIVLVPTPQAAYSMVIKYFRAPSELVTATYTTSTGTVSGSVGAQSVNLADYSQLGADEAAVTVDFMRSVMPFTPLLDSIAGNLEATGGLIDGITTDVSSLSGKAMYVALYGTSPVPQIPEAAIPLLVNRTIAVCHRATGRLSEAESWDAAVKKEEDRVRLLLSPRTDGLPIKIVGSDLPGAPRRWRYTLPG